MECPDCGQQNPAGALVCTNCRADLYDMLVEQVATKQIDRDKTRDLRLDDPTSSRPVMIYVGNETPIVIERRNGQIIGRADSNDPHLQVHVDLTDYDAQKHGVSRRHARIDARSSPPVITDLNSYNGTYINGEKLAPDTPHPLDSSDEIRLGRLTVRVYYK